MFRLLYNPLMHFNNTFMLYINFKTFRSFYAYLEKLDNWISSLDAEFKWECFLKIIITSNIFFKVK